MTRRHVDALRKKETEIVSVPTVLPHVAPAPNPILKIILGRFTLPSLVVAFGIVFAASIQLSAFEAHVLNVTAVIDREASACVSSSSKIWQDHDGCDGGKGENIWASQVNILSNNFSGAFGAISGNEICVLFDDHASFPCPSVDTVEGARCYAKAHGLALELNLVSGRLDPDALLAGADMGSDAFDHLGLGVYSTIQEAAEEIEEILTLSDPTPSELVAAAIVGKSINQFYEERNPQAPECIFERSDWEGVEILDTPADVSYLVDEVKEEEPEITEEKKEEPEEKLEPEGVEEVKPKEIDSSAGNTENELETTPEEKMEEIQPELEEEVVEPETEEVEVVAEEETEEEEEVEEPSEEPQEEVVEASEEEEEETEVEEEPEEEEVEEEPSEESVDEPAPEPTE